MGEILGAHGIRGEVAVRVHSENPARFGPGAQLLVGRDAAAVQPMRVASSRRHGKRLFVLFEGVSDRAEAQVLSGSLVFIAAKDLPELEAGAFWEHQLLGLEVREPGGRTLGVISSIMVREEQDLWEVATSAGPVLLPAARDLVKTVDLEARVVVVEPPEGLFNG